MRTIIQLNQNWQFTKEQTALPSTYPTTWQTVDLPHTWNANDGQDGNGSYYRGTCWYAKSFPTPITRASQRVYIEVLAASQSGRVFVNGKEVAYHEGGYSRFRADISEHLVDDMENLIAIEVDNSPSDVIYPQMADFTFYGGLYRGVNLIVVDEVHFSLDHYGAPGIMATPRIKEGGAEIELVTWIEDANEDYTVRYVIRDQEGTIVSETWRPATQPSVVEWLDSPHLWQGVEDPYLYTITATLVRRNQTIDEITTKVGIREFYVDANKGFFLNGKPMKLRGVSRHQDKLHIGNALTKEDHELDAQMIHELGANTIRLAHYQHSEDFYDACDRYGFIVWAEIPYISSQSANPDAHINCREQMKDLVFQNYNHASICFWGISNEITISGEKPGLVENHRDLHELIKSIDPTRLTTIAHVSMLGEDSELHNISDVESYNHYFGWYGGDYTQNETWLDAYHTKYPTRCLGISEYGAEGIITYQPDEAKCRDYSEAYQAEYHEHMARIIGERDYLWSTHVWNMFDFGCAARDEGGVSGRNNKGLVTLDRKIKKEAFYVYKAYWSKQPFVYVCGRRYAQRAHETTTIKIYSNLPEVTLYVNQQEVATLSGSKVFVFENVALVEGFNHIKATANDVFDCLTLERVEEKPEIYTLVDDEGEIDTGLVANWFDQSAAEAANATLQFPEGYYSIKSTINELLDSPEASEFIVATFAAASGMKLKAAMLRMMGDKTLEGMMDMAASMGKDLPENMLLMVNMKLNTIEKIAK